jgi:hypothetical protein
MMEISGLHSVSRAPRRDAPERWGQSVRNAGVPVIVPGTGAPRIAPPVDQVVIGSRGARGTPAKH